MFSDEYVVPEWLSYSGTEIDFWGNSNTAGYGLTSPSTQRWCALLCNELSLVENNYGISGTTLQYQAELGSGAEPSLYTRHDTVVPAYADQKLIFIEYGINDAKDTFSTYTTEELGIQLLEVLNYMHNTLGYPKEKIKFINDFHTTLTGSWYTEYRANVDEITAVCASFGCQCINVRDKFIAYGGTLQDIVHPTAQGHEIIKQIILEDLE